MPQNTPKIFLDTSVVISALFSSTGGARELFRFGELGKTILYIGKFVLEEADDVLLRKDPESRAILANFLDSANVKIVDTPSIEAQNTANRLMAYAPDARVLAEVIQAEPDFFASHDREHFLNNLNLSALSFQIGSPGDALAWIRKGYQFPDSSSFYKMN